MTSPSKLWENQNVGILRSSNPNPVIPQNNASSRSIPILPPRPNSISSSNYGYNSYSPYSGFGYNSYSSMPYNNMYGGGYGGYGYNNYNMYGGMSGYSTFGSRNDTEGRFIQFAEDSTRSTFANVESIVRAFSSIAMMLDNTFFAMTSSFRAVLSVAENFGRLRSVFGQIWYSINLFRLLKWLYRKLMTYLGYKLPESTSVAWDQAINGVENLPPPASNSTNWSTLAFFGVLISAPYIISKFLPKFEDKSLPENWKSSGVRAKAAFDFTTTNNNELSLNVNDEILLAPKYIQDEMKLTNTGWAFAVRNGRSGVVPLNYIVIMKRINRNENIPVPRIQNVEKEKKVTFGKNEIINLPSNDNENVIEDEKKNLTENALDSIEETTIN